MSEFSDRVNWMSHPVVTAAIGCAAGVGFAMQWLAPAQLGNLRYEVEDARRISEKSKADAETISGLKHQLSEAQKAASLAELNGLLSLGSPYPSGLAHIKIGDQISILESSFAVDQIEKQSTSYWFIKTEHNHFNRLAASFSGNTPDVKISRLVYFVAYDSPLRTNSLLRHRLIECLGLPETTTGSSSDSLYYWTLPAGLRISASELYFAVEADTNVTSSISKPNPKKK